MLTKGGRVEILKWLISGPFNMSFHLAKNNPAPADADLVIGDLTEADFAGYAALTGISFPVPTINGSDEGESDSPVLTWTAGAISAPQTIYLMYMKITGADSAIHLFGVSRFSASITLVNPGEEVKKTVNLYSNNIVP